MKRPLRIRRNSLLWRVLLATSVTIVALFSGTAYLISSFAIQNSERSIADEVQASLREFELLWRTRAASLARESRLLSTMSDVRGAFSTRDPATIRDAASELWSPASNSNSFLRVFDPEGQEIGSLGTGTYAPGIGRLIRSARGRFPGQQSGFIAEASRLHYVILTPVYVSAGSDSELLNVLVTGFAIDDPFAANLSRMSAGSDFVFSAAGRPVASTIRDMPSAVVGSPGTGMFNVPIHGTRYAALTEPLLNLDGAPVGHLTVLRSLAASDQRFRDLKTRVVLILAGAILIGVLLSYLLAQHIIEPIQAFDEAAAEIERRNYGYRLAIDRDDEIGRLARTFNAMCDSIQSARKELIAQERLNTIGRLSSSIVHDLRNPLAAIYGGAEMLADNEALSPQQSRRLALSIYSASRHVRDMLRTLSDSARGKAEPVESCRLSDVVEAARDVLAPIAEKQGTDILVSIPEGLELPMERTRMERVFFNLVSNSLEATGAGGIISISAREDDVCCLVAVDDTGAGIPDEIRRELFLPFVTRGKRSGLGLGLALSRQTVLDHGGDLWLDAKDGPGTRFQLRLPK